MIQGSPAYEGGKSGVIPQGRKVEGVYWNYLGLRQGLWKDMGLKNRFHRVIVGEEKGRG